MLPWIRGWGADVEVLEPQNLREMIFNELTQTVEIYKN
jgi:CRISPR-associated endonuclease/helicase Cas3